MGKEKSYLVGIRTRDPYLNPHLFKPAANLLYKYN